MKRINTHRSRAVLGGIAWGLLATQPLLADDTEILVGHQLDPGNPNILFIVDTSGSMASQVVVGDGYDPAIVYEGQCRSTELYWAQQGTGAVLLPSCAFDTWILPDSMRCAAAAESLATVGSFRDRYAQWNPNGGGSWDEVARAETGAEPTGKDRLTECSSDAGVDGEGDALWPANGVDGPWSDDESKAIDWDTSGELYIFYSGNYLNWAKGSGQDGKVVTRMEVVQDVAGQVLGPLSGVNIGLMRFSTDAQGGMVLHEMADVGSSRSSLLDTVNKLSPSGNTPLAETLYEANQYYAGRKVDYGVNSVGPGGSALPSVPASQDDAGFYKSPITLQCQRNYVVLLTDGLPKEDEDANTAIQQLPDFSGTCTDNCLDELSHYLAKADLRSGAAFSGDQNVLTYTIGFHTDQKLLQQAATGTVPVFDADGEPTFDANGDAITREGYFIANDQDQLLAAFDDIISAIQTTAESFTAPAVSVNTVNRLTHRDDLYFAMFRPADRGQPHWDGNLKKYRLGRPGGAADGSVQTIIDANGNRAVADDGSFVDGATSFWSTGADEGDVGRGGFLSTLTTQRKVYTNISGGTLTAGNNAVHENNSDLTAAMLNVDADDRDDLLQWARGVKPDGTARQIIGDPLHAEPVVIAYDGDKFALFLTTNDGYLHALDPEPVNPGATNLELFSFIPKEMLPKLEKLKENKPQAQFRASKAYGLDGPMTFWIDESDGNLVVDSGERAYIYFGMRRGGRNYYALDVTDATRPKLVWSIQGGSGDFAELGQSWSAALPGVVKVNGSKRDVLFLGGGYDTNQDAKDRPSNADSQGRAVYIVDARTGDRLWWASIDNGADLKLDDMTYSVPGDMRVVDTDQDGLDDRVYFGDTGGQVWRLDIDNGADNLKKGITGAIFADIGAGGESGNRRIYTAPSVNRIVDEHFGSFLAVSVGTGHRAHPLESDVADAFYVFRDINVFTAPVDPRSGAVRYPPAIVPGDLLDVTNNIDPKVSDLNNRKGWFIRYQRGEKSLSSPLSVLDRVFFTTYIPEAAPVPGCEPVAVLGGGRVYSLNIASGRPITQSDQPAPDDRYQELGSGGIPPSPVLVFSEPGCENCEPGEPVSEITMMVSTETFDPQILNIPRKTYWVQEDIDE